jgi:hypothetical protein
MPGFLQCMIILCHQISIVKIFATDDTEAQSRLQNISSVFLCDQWQKAGAEI